MKKGIRSIALIMAMVLLLSVCGAPARASESAAQHVNVLALLCEGSYVIVPLVLTFDLEKNTVRIINFFYQTQIDAVTKKGSALSMPMTFLGYCEPGEIVKAYENTFGIPIDKYIFYDYSNYKTVVSAFGLLCPVTLEISDEVMGDEEYSTINGTMKMFAKSLKFEYTPLTQAGIQALDALALLAYLVTIPDRIWESGDRFTMMMEDYAYWDAKERAVIEALRPVISQMDPDAVLAFAQQALEDQETDITQKDLAAMFSAVFTFPQEEPYFTVPGFEGVEMEDFDANALTGVYGYDSKMLVYDNEAMARRIRAFIYGE